MRQAQMGGALPPAQQQQQLVVLALIANGASPEAAAAAAAAHGFGDAFHGHGFEGYPPGPFQASAPRRSRHHHTHCCPACRRLSCSDNARSSVQSDEPAAAPCSIASISTCGGSVSAPEPAPPGSLPRLRSPAHEPGSTASPPCSPGASQLEKVPRPSCRCLDQAAGGSDAGEPLRQTLRRCVRHRAVVSRTPRSQCVTPPADLGSPQHAVWFTSPRCRP